MDELSISFSYHITVLLMRSYNPAFNCLKAVWALPHSLAATKGISFDFFSSGY